MERRDVLKIIASGLLSSATEACTPTSSGIKPDRILEPKKGGAQQKNTREHELKREIPADIAVAIKKLEARFGLKKDEYAIIIDPASQRLFLIKNGETLKEYSVSTGKKGIGNTVGSQKTPFGTHRIKEKIGLGQKIGTILVGEGDKNGTIAPIIADTIDTPFDYVTTRLMRLDGQEPRINKGGETDSHQRDIYIHGTPEEGLLGRPASHGCIRMKNTDIVKLFDVLPPRTLVEILNKEFINDHRIASGK